MLNERSQFLIPLSAQRYSKALNYIKDFNAPFVIDLGCNECEFIFYLTRSSSPVKGIIGVDVNPVVLRRGFGTLKNSCIPSGPSHAVPVSLIRADIVELPEEFLRNYRQCPFVTLLEVVEHLQEKDVYKMAETVFGRLLPQAVFLTTPNREYNSVLSEAYGTSNKTFRHPDHKFEWTRAEFSRFCRWVSQKFYYSTHMDGIGQCIGYEGNYENSYASHSVLFIRYPPVDLPFSQPSDPLYTIDVLVEDPIVKEESYYLL